MVYYDFSLEPSPEEPDEWSAWAERVGEQQLVVEYRPATPAAAQEGRVRHQRSRPTLLQSKVNIGFVFSQKHVLGFILRSAKQNNIIRFFFVFRSIKYLTKKRFSLDNIMI